MILFHTDLFLILLLTIRDMLHFIRLLSWHTLAFLTRLYSLSCLRTEPFFPEMFINSREAIAEAIIVLLLVFLRLEEEYWFSLGLFFTTRRGVLVFSRSFFTGSSFAHATFWPKSENEKSCHGEQIFAKREFFDHALRWVLNNFLTLRTVLEKTVHINKQRF